jgi:N5-(cytidine 5'-diphosphoramidyl)-L-glutamine hydrolase
MGRGKIDQHRLCQQESGRDKLKYVLVSQRVDIHDVVGERRDALDQRWTTFLNETGAVPISVPNHIRTVMEVLSAIPHEGIVLTGGNLTSSYGGNAPGRDEIGKCLIDYAMEQSIPLLGIYRGLQSIVMHLGGALEPIEGHVAARHHVRGHANWIVNRYHGRAIRALPYCIEIMASSEDGSVEMLKHVSFPILGLMWHPQREVEYIMLFRNLWAKKAIEL